MAKLEGIDFGENRTTLGKSNAAGTLSAHEAQGQGEFVRLTY